MLFTYIFSYRGTTAIRQAKGEDFKETMEFWVNSLEGAQFGKEEKVIVNLDELKSELKENNPIPLKNILNVWCAFMRLEHGNALLNIIQTHDAERQNDFADMLT